MPQIYDMDQRLYFPSEERRAEDFFDRWMSDRKYEIKTGERERKRDRETERERRASL